MSNKKQKGVFYTMTNPFSHQSFLSWFELIPETKKLKPFLEPFAGDNNIPKMLEDIMVSQKWDCFDIIPNDCPKIGTIIERDTINNFPTGYNVCITNPPYLAKNSATRDSLKFPVCEYDDIYKLALDKILNNVEYVAVIIPESFITSGLFRKRLYSVISLTKKMFNDTECPVCLALFVPENTKQNVEDFLFFKGDKKIGSFINLKKKMDELEAAEKIEGVRFNDKRGNIGLYAVDNNKGKSIRFVDGDLIDSKKIKTSSRSITKIYIDTDCDKKMLLEKCNKILNDFRLETSDLFLTSFKGLSKEGDYRRRLDFKMARMILNKAIREIEND